MEVEVGVGKGVRVGVGVWEGVHKLGFSEQGIRA